MKRLQQFTFLIFCALALLLAARLGPVQEPASQTGDIVAGGRIYDNWMLALDLLPPEGNHPLWDTQSNSQRQGSVTWQCSSCHGWDYKGVDGTYRPGSPYYTGFPGVTDMIGASQSEIIAWLYGARNPDHDFSAYIGDLATSDLTAFLRSQQIDTNLIIDPQTGAAFGDNENGRVLYADRCASCHGDTGRLIDLSSGSVPAYLGDTADTDPWRAVHIIRFGNSFGRMPGTEDYGWSLRLVGDLMAFLLTLPRGNPDLPLAQGQPFTGADIRNQGEIEPIVRMGLAILAIVAIPLAWDIYNERFRKPAEAIDLADKRSLFFENQSLHLVGALGLVLVAAWAAGQPGVLTEGEAWGAPTATWFWFGIVVSLLHHVWVWLFWRGELHYGWVSKRLGSPRGFNIYARGFGVWALLRGAAIVAVAIASPWTTDLAVGLRLLLALVCSGLAAWLVYSVLRYFTVKRALGADHFEARYRSLGLEKRAIFAYTGNGMYTFGLLMLYIPGLLWASQAALWLALLNHMNTWLHYFATERPDIRRIYGDKL